MNAVSPRIRAGLVAASLLTVTASAQTEALAASESQILVAPSTAVTSVVSSSASGTISAAVGNPLGNQNFISENFRVRGNAVWMPDAPETSEPVIAGFGTGLDVKGGGLVDSLFGYNLNQGVTPLVEVGGVLSPNAHTSTKSQILLTLPEGKDAFNNPKGLVDVSVQFGPTVVVDPGEFRYMPLLESSEVPRTGEDYSLRLYTPPGALAGVLLGAGGPFFPLPLGPLGSLVLSTFPLELIPFSFVPTGVATYTLPIPDNPALLGVNLELQAIAITNLVTGFGSVSPLLTTTVQD